MIKTEAVTPEPMIDAVDYAKGLDAMVPLRNLRLFGRPGGYVRNHSSNGDTARFHYLRDYEEGDDYDQIDLEATLYEPVHRPQIRVNRENVTPGIWLATDMLQRHHAGRDGWYDERSLAISAAFSLLFTAYTQNLSMGLIAANDRECQITPKLRKGKRALLNIGDQLADMMNEGNEGLPAPLERPNLSQILNHLGDVASQRLVVVVSDFRSLHFWPDHPENNWAKELQNIAGRHNQIIAVEITSPEDFSISSDINTIANSPLGKVWHGKQGKAYRKQYEKNAIEQQQAINTALINANAIHVNLSTDDPSWHSHLADQLRAHR